MNNFPLEIIELIVGHISAHGDLYKCLFINTLFYKATLPVLWHSPIPVRSNGRTAFLQYRQIFHCGAFTDSLGFFNVSNRRHIRRLSFPCLSSMSHIAELLPLAPLLTELVFIRVVLNDGDMENVARRCRHLLRIALHSLDSITPETIVSLTQHCPRLTGVSLSDCRKISATALLPLLETNDVKQLTVGLPPSKTRVVSLSDKIPEAVSLLSYRHGSVRQNDPYNTSFACEWARLIQSSNNGWTLRLTELCLCYVTDRSLLVPFLETHTRLKSLTMESCHLNFGTLATIAIFLPDLRRLDLSYSYGFSARGLKNMVKLGCRQLSLLDLTGCEKTCKNFDLMGPMDRLHRYDIERLRWEPEISARLRPSKIPTLIPLKHRQPKPALTSSLGPIRRRRTTYEPEFRDTDIFLPPETGRILSSESTPRGREWIRRNAISSPDSYDMRHVSTQGRVYQGF